MSKNNFKEFKVWQKSRALVKDVYILLRAFPDDEKFGLISQMKRAAISIPSNIAEGTGRGTNKDFNRFLYISLGSSYELETQFILSQDLEFIKDEKAHEIINNISEVQRMIHGLIQSLDKSL
ncbi:MAG: four helix bundle protein [Cyclobacteriaceae bacterium]|nr:four helix bundle protein [Cyclobacteriaceae bacterium]